MSTATTEERTEQAGKEPAQAQAAGVAALTDPSWKVRCDDIDDILQKGRRSTIFKPLYENKAVRLCIYSPFRRDMQNHIQPFERAEIYIVRSGTAVFNQSGEKTSVKAGDVLFVAPRAIHNYEAMSEDFSALLVMYDLPEAEQA